MLNFRFVPWERIDPVERAEWQRLLAATQGAPDLSIDWAQALIEAHRIPLVDVQVLILSDESRARAVLPLRLTTRAKGTFRLLTIEPLVNSFSLHGSVLADIDLDACVDGLMTAIGSRYGHWAEFVFNSLVKDAGLSIAIRAFAAKHRLFVESQDGDCSPFLGIRGGWEDFLRTKSGNFRSGLKRKSRRLLETDGVDIRFIVDPDEMLIALSAIHEIENKSWKAAQGTAITSRPWEEAFYAAVATKFSPSGQVLVTLITLHGKPLAFDLTLLGGGSAYCLKTSFDGAHADLSAGIVLRSELMKKVFAMGISEYDFLGKNERYKLEWSETIRQAETIRVVNSRSWPGWSLGVAIRLRRSAQRIKARLGPGGASTSPGMGNTLP
jgi:CelD/BcsL family acetyltransferase involved in cellulose biosynthesis